MLFPQQRFDQRQDVFGYDGVALVSGVGVVALHQAGDAVDVVEQEGQQRDGVFTGQRGVVGGEGVDVVGAVVGREGDAGEDDLGTRGLDGFDHLG